MKTIYFSVRDVKSENFGQLFPSATRGTAERSFQESLKSPDSIAGKYPSDFALYAIFVFDDESGLVVERFEPPQLVVEATSLVS